MEQGISKLSLDKGNKLKEGHGGLPRERIFCVCGEEKKKRMNVRKDLVLMCEEVFMEKVCARIKHGRKLCSNYLLQSLWIFGSISCSSQIHRWICVKFKSVLI